MSRKKRTYLTKYPGHHQAVDATSRALAGSSQRKLLAKANRLLNEPLIEDTPEVHTVIDDRVEAEMIGRGKGLKPLWHSRGRP